MIEHVITNGIRKTVKYPLDKLQRLPAVMTQRQLAKSLGREPSAISGWRRLEAMPYHVQPNGYHFVYREELIAWMEATQRIKTKK